MLKEDRLTGKAYALSHSEAVMRTSVRKHMAKNIDYGLHFSDGKRSTKRHAGPLN